MGRFSSTLLRTNVQAVANDAWSQHNKSRVSTPSLLCYSERTIHHVRHKPTIITRSTALCSNPISEHIQACSTGSLEPHSDLDTAPDSTNRRRNHHSSPATLVAKMTQLMWMHKRRYSILDWLSGLKRNAQYCLQTQLMYYAIWNPVSELQKR